jgi:hypothetical protein
MRLEMYVRDREISEILEDFFALLHEHLVRVEGSQTHVFLRRKEKKKRQKGAIRAMHAIPS